MKLKRIQLIALILEIIICSYASAHIVPEEDKDTKASIKWEKTSHDFGKIVQNIPVTVEFEFKSSSMVPLVINDVRPTCGCTVADYPKEPVRPGNSAKITVNYNAKSIGYFTKSIIVNSNAGDEEMKLFIKGEVVKN